MCRGVTFSFLLLLLSTSRGECSIFDVINDSDITELTVIVDAFPGTVDAVKNVWRQRDITINVPVRLNIINGTDNGPPAGLLDTRELADRIQNLKDDAHDDGNSSVDALYTQVVRALSDMPQHSAVLVFTERAPDNGFLLMEKAREQASRVYVIWTGKDAGEDRLWGFRPIADAGNGLLETVSQVLEHDESGAKAIPAKPRILSGATDAVNARIMGEVSAEEVEDVNPEPKTGKVRFPVDKPQASVSERISAVDEKDIRDKVLTKFLTVVPMRVEAADDASLFCSPGSQCQLQLVVTYYLSTPQTLSFGAESNMLRVQNVAPPSHTLGPSNTVTVAITYTAPAVVPDGGEAKLNFIIGTANGAKIVQSIVIYVTAKRPEDTQPPKMSYSFRSECTGFDTPQTCHGSTWEFEATFHDPHSGLKKIASQPYGLVFKKPFLIGTKSPVSVYNLASCCDSKVDIWCEDLLGNRVEKKLDVFNQGLLTGEIAAIVVGVLLIVFLIIAAIVSVILIKRRNRAKLVLPRYEGNTS